ncbi:MAG: hypothetical protein MI975_13705, partial [Cytophagales bacterium]|nr:hypothetical protein [Cytophagales bacterium]
MSVTPTSNSSDFCVTGTAITLDNIRIDESATGDFSIGSYTVQIILPVEFEYQLSSPAPSVTSGAGDIFQATGFFLTSKVFQIDVVCIGNTSIDYLEVSGLVAQAISSTASSDITFVSGGMVSGLDTETIELTSDAAPTVSAAGPDQSVCITGGVPVSLSGNTPLVGTGTWSIISGLGGT